MVFSGCGGYLVGNRGRKWVCGLVRLVFTVVLAGLVVEGVPNGVADWCGNGSGETDGQLEMWPSGLALLS